MDRSPALPHSSPSLQLTVCVALAVLAVCFAALAAPLCEQVLRQMAQPILAESTRSAFGE